MARVTGHIRLVPRKRNDQWYIRWRDASGKQDQKCLGPAWTKRGRPQAGYWTQKMTEDALADKLAELRRGEAPERGDAGKTFGDAVEEWLRYCRDDRGLEESTLRSYRNTARGPLMEELGADTPLAKIDQDRIERYRTSMLAEGSTLSRRSAQKHLVNLGSIFKRARRLKWVTSDPTADVEPINLKRSGDFNVLSVDEVEAVASKAGVDLPAERAEIYEAAIIVAAYTGLRTGELRALQWRDVDFVNAMLHVRTSCPIGGGEKAPKSGQVRSVPLMDDAAAALDRLSRREHFTAPTDRVFASPTGGMLGDKRLRKRLYAAMEAAGIDRTSFPVQPGFRFHDLRHTFGTLAVQVWPLSDVQAYMGHADIQTTMRYVHHIPKTKAAREFTEAVKKMRESAGDGLPVATEEVAP